MNVIELTNRYGRRFILDFDSGWKITENEDPRKPANWCNDHLGMNLDAQEPYSVIRERLARKLLVKESPIV